ncbi:oxidoreductase, aldo/keto reductase [gut metagenome]|uniref:Oxidoreductase, aldo/keto reductase n=1 Tax=gut metagenome TaxID=749906 RepID=J9GCY8_9ZZZZ
MEAMGHSSSIPCTSCHYCTPGCPQSIPIPEIFSAMNDLTATGAVSEARRLYADATAEGGLASSCIACGQCEGVCPQHLPIIDDLVACAEALE